MAEDEGVLGTLPDEIVYQIALETDLDSLLDLCSSHSYYNRYCQDAIFWRDKGKHNFPHVDPDIINKLIPSDDLNLARNGYIILSTVEGVLVNQSDMVTGKLLYQIEEKNDLALLEYVIDRVTIDEYYQRALSSQAGARGHIENGILIVSKYPDNVSYYFLLNAAARNGQLDMIVALNEHLIDLRYINIMFESAAKNGHMETMEYLMEKGATNFNRAMEETVHQGHIDIIRRLIEAGANSFDETMALAASWKHIEIVQLMIDNGATDFNHAMSEAARVNSIEIVRLLIRANDFNESLRMASINGNLEIARLMIEMGVTSQNLDDSLKLAAEFGHLELVRLLLTTDADSHEDSIVAAAGAGHLDVVRILAPLLGEGYYGRHWIYVLGSAIENNQPDIIEYVFSDEVGLSKEIMVEMAKRSKPHFEDVLKLIKEHLES